MGPRSISKFIVSLSVTVALLSGCRDDFDFKAHYPGAEQRKAFTEAFVSHYGTIDPNHDWSMAQLVSVSVSAPAPAKATRLRIFSGSPVLATSSLMADYDLTRSSDLHFDAVKGLSCVYAIVSAGDATLFSGYFEVIDGRLDLQPATVLTAPVSSPRAATRALAATNGVTLGEVEDLSFHFNAIDGQAWVLPSESSITNIYYGPYATLNELGDVYYADCVSSGIAVEHFCTAKLTEDEIASVISRDALGNWILKNVSVSDKNGTYYGKINFPSYYEFEASSMDELCQKIYDFLSNASCNGWRTAVPTPEEWISLIGRKDNGVWVEIQGAELLTELWLDRSISVTQLKGVSSNPAEPWQLSLGAKLFGSGAFFQEQVKYFNDQKTAIPDYDLKQVEAGFSITSEGGEIRLPFVYGATDSSDQLGYVYYKPGEDPLTKPHFVLIRDGRPSANIHWNASDGTPVGNRQLADWDINIADPSIWGEEGDTQVYGREYKLSFFGENYDEEGTFDFPAGYRIVFFIAPRDFDGTNWGSFHINDFNYSLPELNKRIGHFNMNGTTNSLVEGREDKLAGARKATAWTTLGMTFLGFEDGGRDEDLNDMVFWVEGSFTPDVAPFVVPVNHDAKPACWRIACEDLVSAGDYDFNDIVLEIQHVAGQSTVYVQPLAAGVTLPAEFGMRKTSFGEIHESFGVSSQGTRYPMINTGSGSKYNGLKARRFSYELNKSQTQNFSITDRIADVWIDINNQSKNTMLLISAPDPKSNDAPQMLCLPSDWEWPNEHVNIEVRYPGFRDWVTNHNLVDWMNGDVVNWK